MIFSGKVVWVSGATSGIGRALARMFGHEGATVALSGRRAEALEGVFDEVCELGGHAVVLPLDVADRAAVDAAAERLLADHGRIDALVTSAGMNVPPRDLEHLSGEDWDRVVAVNLTGAYNLVRAALPAMRRQGDGLIVNIASIAGKVVFPPAGAAYIAAKHGVVALNHAINREEGRHNIRACAVCPGEVNTPLMDARAQPPGAEARAAMIQPEDLAALVRAVALMPPRTCVTELTVMPTARQ